MDGYLSKPIDPEKLFTAVEADCSADCTAVIDMSGRDTVLPAASMHILMDECPTRLDAIRSAIEARDADRIRLEAGGLKDAAANLGALSLFHAAQTLERIGEEARFEAAEAAWRQLSAEAALMIAAADRGEEQPDPGTG